MLSTLSIRDFVIIDRLDLEFGSGLNVLTGETGAGKSILLDALGLALGNRADGAPVREGASQGSVTATFEGDPAPPLAQILLDGGIPAEPTLMLKRVLSADHRSRAFVNDQPVSLALLRKIGGYLVEIHGQHDDRGLVQASAHRALLDDFAGARSLLEGTAQAWESLVEARKALAEAEQHLAAVRAEADHIRQATAELTALAPAEGEEEALAETRTRMLAARRIQDRLMEVYQDLTSGPSGGVESGLSAALRRLEKIGGEADKLLDPVIGPLERALMEAGEGIAALDEVLRAAGQDEDRVDAVEERLFALRDAGRKYRVPVSGLAGLAVEFTARLAALEAGEDRIDELDAAVVAAGETYDAAASVLHEARQIAAGKLDKAVGKELAPLKLERAAFTTDVVFLPPEEASASGRDRVEFQVVTNPGAPAGPLGKIASGGELARFILALKVALAGSRARALSNAAMIFDEVDRGVGGATADAVGTRLAALADNSQVLLVTHSPQVAAKADRHFQISKVIENGQARTRVSTLSAAQRDEEIARMLAGATITDAARAAARSLMAAS